MKEETDTVPPANARTPRNPKGGGRRAGVSAEEIEKRLSTVETMLIRRHPDRTIVGFCFQQWGIKERQAREYIATVRGRWREESAGGAAREARREHMRRSLDDLYTKAVSTSATKPDPDVSGATRVAKLLMDLDGLQAPPQPTSISVTGAVATTNVPTKGRAELEAFLRGTKAAR